MTGWLIDTLVWSAALIALVLLLRGPVARHFGAKAAYALWSLPFLRLLMPPIELPAWLSPEAMPSSTAADAQMVLLPDAWSTGAALSDPLPEIAPSIDWIALALTVWLVGAAVFLLRRFRLYFQMRSELLADATPVGEAGKVRLVETPAVASPVAFGVLDKVVALPPHFMAAYNRLARDLALEHELEHHRGHDLLANFAVQPLFALHWFNPLAWVGWRALRCDQEAACDARVVATRAADERITYAETIAGFAAGPEAAPRAALVAPMACPVLGEKSIIHRLRSLNMSEISPSRRLAGRALIAAGVVALPLTASITYAEDLTIPEAPAAPAAPRAPHVAAAPIAPLPPASPLALEAPSAPPAPQMTPPSATVPVPPAPPTPPPPPSPATSSDRVTIVHKVVEIDSAREEAQERRAEIRAAAEEARQQSARVRTEVRIAREEALSEALEARERATIEMSNARGQLAKISVRCDKEGKRNRWTDENGSDHIMMCTSEVMAHALTGLKQARAAIAEHPELSEEARKSVLRNLDRQIAELKKTS